MDVAEEVTVALGDPTGTVLVCMRSPEETMEIVSFLQANGFATNGTATAQEMLDRAIVEMPGFLIVAKESSVIGIQIL